MFAPMIKRFSFIITFVVCTATAVYGQTSYLSLVDSSYADIDRGDLPAAAESLREAMRMEPANPNNYALLTNLGTILRRQGKTDEALEAYTAALGRFPQSTVILSNRASLYLEMGQTEKASADYNLILAADSANEDALYNRGLMYINEHNYMAAEQNFDKMIAMNKETLYGRLGYAVLEKVRGNNDESERIYNYLISRFPEEWQLYESRADLYFIMGKNARAMADLDKVFAHTQPSALAFVLRGKIKLARFEKASAARDFQKAKDMGYDANAIDGLMKLTW
jgi:tetratricopeptide (TPR) repeat protein